MYYNKNGRGNRDKRPTKDMKTQATWKVETRNNETNTIIETRTFETEEAALVYIENQIDDDLYNDEYETYDYLLNGETIA